MPEFFFQRYVNGERMADDVLITKQATLEDAIPAALRLCWNSPKSVLVYIPQTPWRDIESAPRDGTWIFIYKDSWHGAIKAKWDAIDGVDSPFMAWVFQDEFLCIGCAEGCLGYNEDIEDGYMPTHWMPLPEPPND